MISYVVGRVEEIEENKITIEVGGIGYEIYLPYPDVAKVSVGVEKKVYVYRYVYDNSEEWYGFLSKDSKNVFLLLTKVNSIGPKLALRILSSFSPSEIIKAISMKNVKFFSSIKGVGEKVAERIVSELKSEVGKLNVPYSEEKSNIEEIMLALRSLGYNQSEIFKMISVAKEQYANFDYLDTPKAIQICLSIYKK